MNFATELRNSWRFLLFLLTRFGHDRCASHAATLTYTTLFAVVPMLTVTYSILAMIPDLRGTGEVIQDFLLSTLIPDAGDGAREHLAAFAMQARKLTGVGVLVLLITSLALMLNVERAFNNIWRVGEPRKGISGFLVYWAVLSLGPLLIGVGFVTSSYLMTLPIVTETTESVGGTHHLLEKLPMILSMIAFSLLYLAVPNTKVHASHAVLGGLLVAFLFEAFKSGFTMFVKGFPSYQIIYGAFAFFPLLLMWIYLSWTIILMGGVFVRSLSAYERFEKIREVPYPNLVGVLGVLELLWRKQREGRGATEDEILMQVPDITQDAWEVYAVELFGQRMICRTDNDEFMLTRDLAQIQLWELARMMPWPLPQRQRLPDPDRVNFRWYSDVRSCLAVADEQACQSLTQNIAEIFRNGDEGKIIQLPGQAEA